MRRFFRNVLTISFTFFLAFPLSAQTGYIPPNPLSPPVITPPVMQSPLTITPPTVEGVTPLGMDSTQTAPAKKTSASSLPASLSDITNPASLLSALGGDDTDADGMDALSTILGGTSTTANTQDSAVLQKILDLLERQQEKSSVSAAQAAVPQAIKPQLVSGAEIVRFVIGGYDITSSITSLVSSVLAKDGSFLLTGERWYAAVNGKQTEFFYLLFKKSVNGTFILYADVTQNTVNKNSFIYQLVHRSPYKGVQTGDLVVFKSSDPAWNLDFVIRILSPSGTAASVR